MALLTTVALASCGGGGHAPQRPPASSIVAYSATTDRMCSDLIGAIQRAFANAAGDPHAALARYASDVGAAGARLAAVTPPASLAAFHRAAVAHIAGEAAKLRHAAQRSAHGDAGAAQAALGDHEGLLPRGIPAAVLPRAPNCRAVSPAAIAPGAPS